MDNQQRTCRVLAITNNKGGVGKTSSTVAIGSILQAMGYRVLLVDLDPQANATSCLKIDKHTIFQSRHGLTKKVKVIQTGLAQSRAVRLVVHLENIRTYSHMYCYWDIKRNCRGENTTL